jgi:type II secretory pathway pseudopilin PulG
MSGHSGFTVLEVMAAAVMLAAAMVITVQVLALSRAQARDSQRRQLAIQVAGNLLERLTATNWDRLDSAVADAKERSKESVSRLPGGELDVTIESDSAPPRSRRITVTIRYRSRGGEFTSPVRLTAWSFAAEGTDE